MKISVHEGANVLRGDISCTPTGVVHEIRIMRQREAKDQAEVAFLQMATNEIDKRDGGGNAVFRNESGSGGYGGYGGYDARGGGYDANRSGKYDGLVTGRIRARGGRGRSGCGGIRASGGGHLLLYRREYILYSLEE